MGTRSIVYARTESGIKGVYVHWDGYPDGRLPVLAALMARDGVDKVVCTLLARPSGWSHLKPSQDGTLREYESDGRFEAVPGYGVQYTDTEMPDPFNDGKMVRQGNEAYSDTTAESRNIWIEWLYVIEQDGAISYAENLPGTNWDALDWHVYPGQIAAGA